RQTLVFVEDYLMPNAVRLISVTEQIDTSTSQGMLMVQLLGAVAQSEREGIAARVRHGIARRKEEGFPFVPRLPYGWARGPAANSATKSRRGIVPVPEEGEWVKWLAEKYLAGWDSKRLAYELNRLGVPTRSGKPWDFSAALYGLFNPTDAGLIRVEEEVREGRHGDYRYYSPETFYQIMGERQRRKRWRTNTKAARMYLLAGLIDCARCGARLFVQPGEVKGRKYIYYRCKGILSPDGDPCRRVSINGERAGGLGLAASRKGCGGGA